MESSTPSGCEQGRVLTWRSLLFGILGVLLMSGLAGYHDQVLEGTLMIGNHIPAGAFSYFILLGLGWNGIWGLLDRLFKAEGRVRRAMSLSSRELILVMVMTLVACFPPTSGLFRYFHRMLMLPWYFLSNHADWQSYGLLSEHLRPELFPEPWLGQGIESVPAAEYQRVYTNFFTGLARGSETTPLWELPLDAWVCPLMVWGSLLLLMVLTMISLQFLLHRQWAVHEQLSYPVAQVASSFCDMKGSGGRGVPDIFKNRLFWWGFVPIFTLLLLDYLALRYPSSVPRIAESMPDFKRWTLPVTTKIPILRNVPVVWCLNTQTIYFTIVGLAFFVSSEVSLTLGLAPILLAIFGSFYFLGTGTALQSSSIVTSRAGAYVGFAIMLFYTGRHYYLGVLARAIGLKRMKKDDGEAGEHDWGDDVSVLAARVLILAFIGFTIVLSWMCQSWVIAIFYSLLLMILYMVISRIVCESGIPFVQCNWEPAPILLKLLGPAAMGPKAMTFSLWSTGILAQDPRESLMPYVATGIKLSEDAGLKLKRVFTVIVVSVVVAMVVAFLSSTYSLYNYKSTLDGWAAVHIPQLYLNQAAINMSAMDAVGVLEASEAATPLQRLKMIDGAPLDTRYFFYGAVAVLVCTMLRFRFTKFPLHPVLFLMVGTYPISGTWGSFLLGWFIKTLVVKFGGGGVYNKMKPLFVGVIVGELVMVGLTLFIDFFYFFRVGTPVPVKYIIMPG